MAMSSELSEACLSCSISKLRSIISAHPGSINLTDAEGNTPLHLCAMSGDEECVQYLIDSKSDVRAILPEVYHTPLHKAAFNGNTGVIKILIKAGASLAMKTRNGYTPLHSASWKGHFAATAAILEAKADPNISCKANGLALHGASKMGFEKIVSLMLKYGADPLVRDQRGDTCLTVAATPKIRAMLRAAVEGADAETDAPEVPRVVSKPAAEPPKPSKEAAPKAAAVTDDASVKQQLKESEAKCTQLWSLLQSESSARKALEREVQQLKAKLKKLEKSAMNPPATIAPAPAPEPVDVAAAAAAPDLAQTDTNGGNWEVL